MKSPQIVNATWGLDSLEVVTAQILLQLSLRLTFAKKWADAHENGASGQPKLEKEMDLFNNKVGRGLAKTYPNTVSHKTFKNNTRAKVRAGKCRIISNKKLVKSSNSGEK